jgi:hypothetical protein
MSPLTKIAVLFVDPKGVYPGLSVDCWDEDRDARQYVGVAPVIAHPPCQLWGRFAHVNFARWGGEHNRPGNDGGCFSSALASVRRCGGVLEHPAFSDAWAAYGLMRPVSSGGWHPDRQGGYVCEVWQSAYGHKARKRTWLYYVGKQQPLPMRWEHPEGTHQIGFHDQRGKARNKPTVSGRAASATGIEFAKALIGLVNTGVRDLSI